MMKCRMQVDCSTRRIYVYWGREGEKNEWICIYIPVLWEMDGEKERGNQRLKCPPV